MALELTRKKDGDNKTKTPGQKNDAMLKLMELFEKNPFLKIAVPVLLFLILAGILGFIIFGDGVLMGKNEEPEVTQPIMEGVNPVDVFPGSNNIKDEEVLTIIKNDPLSEDVLAKAVYQGYTFGENGLKTALITVGNSKDVLVLSPGDKVGESDWELAEITAEYLIFKAGDNTKKITLN